MPFQKQNSIFLKRTGEKSYPPSKFTFIVFERNPIFPITPHLLALLDLLAMLSREENGRCFKYTIHLESVHKLSADQFLYLLSVLQ